MIEKMNHHYSMTNPATVYDEEALTALELVGRTTAKVNETVEAFNTLEKETRDHLKEQDDDIQNQKDVVIPETIKREVEEHIENGDFDSAINEYAGDLENRLNNLLGKVNEGSTTMDAEVIDARVDGDGGTWSNLGEAVRGQYKKALRRNNNATVFVNNTPVVTFEKNVSVEVLFKGNTHVFYNSDTYTFTDVTITLDDIANKSLFFVLYNLKDGSVSLAHYEGNLSDDVVIIGTLYEDVLELNLIGKNTYGTNKMVDSFSPVMPFIWTDKPIIVTRVENTSNWTFTLTIPSDVLVMENKLSYYIESQTLTFETGDKSFLYKLLYNTETGELYFRYYLHLLKANEIILGIYHPNYGFHINGRNYGDESVNLTLTPMIIGPSNKFVEFDTAKMTVTFPEDTLLMCNRGGLTTYYGLFNNLDNTVVSYSHLSTSAIVFYYDIDTKTLGACGYSTRITGNKIILATLRTSNGVVSILAPYKMNGKPYNLDGSDFGVKTDGDGISYNVNAINHRGYCNEAPENTLSAYRLSKEKGFKYVECDVSFTSDNVGVLLHDGTVDRTSNGTGNISTLTLSEVKALDFGSWFNSKYAGEKIPTFEEFISLCRNLGLHPYIELKSGSESQVQSLVNTVKKYGMIEKVTWISFYDNMLTYVKKYHPEARLGYVCELSESAVNTALALKTDNNEVFIDASENSITSGLVDLCITNNLPLEVWTVNASGSLIALNPYVSGVTSDSLHAGKVLYDYYREV